MAKGLEVLWVQRITGDLVPGVFARACFGVPNWEGKDLREGSFDVGETSDVCDGIDMAALAEGQRQFVQLSKRVVTVARSGAMKWIVSSGSKETARRREERADIDAQMRMVRRGRHPVWSQVGVLVVYVANGPRVSSSASEGGELGATDSHR